MSPRLNATSSAMFQQFQKEGWKPARRSIGGDFGQFRFEFQTERGGVAGSMRSLFGRALAHGAVHLRVTCIAQNPGIGTGEFI
jgi:hypothetical protein